MSEKFDPKSCTLSEMNRELKRLASRKCRAKEDEDRKKYQAEYDRLVKIKNDRFQTTKKSYVTMTDQEISELDLETTVKAIKSLQSRRCVYPERAQESLEMELKFRAHRDELMEKAQLERLMAKYQ